MQDHYLDLKNPCSKWGGDFNYSIKGDVCPDNVTFDLNEIENLFESNLLSTLYADRGKPMKFAVGNRMFIAPDGGNFFLRTSLILPLRTKFRLLSKTCDGSYDWALFMEYYWGELFFEEGSKSYDYECGVYLNNYKNKDNLFKYGKEDYFSLRNRYLSSKFYPELKRKNFLVSYIEALLRWYKNDA